MNEMINPISPVSIWKDGETKTATKLLLKVIENDLFSQARFYYELLTATDERLAAGNLTMNGSEYTTWNTSPNATPNALAWAGEQLNLTII